MSYDQYSIWIDSEHGNDSNDGSKEHPVRTMQRVMASIPPILNKGQTFTVNLIGYFKGYEFNELLNSVPKCSDGTCSGEKFIINGGKGLTPAIISDLHYLTEAAMRLLKVGDKFRLKYYSDDRKLYLDFDDVVEVGDITDMDICCRVSEDSKKHPGAYVSVMLQAPDGSGKPWPINKAPGRGWFEFIKLEGENNE